MVIHKDTPTGGSRPFDWEQYDILLRCEKAGDFSEWNKWVTSPESSKTGLQEIKLAGADIHGANLEGAILEGAILEGATITKQTFPVLDCPEH